MELQREALQLTKELTVRVNALAAVPNPPQQAVTVTTASPTPPTTPVQPQAVVVDPPSSTACPTTNGSTGITGCPAPQSSLLLSRGSGTSRAISSSGAPDTSSTISCSASGSSNQRSPSGQSGWFHEAQRYWCFSSPFHNTWGCLQKYWQRGGNLARIPRGSEGDGSLSIPPT